MNKIRINSILTVSVLIMAAQGCKQARYGIVKPDRNAPIINQVAETGSTFKFEATPGTATPTSTITFTSACKSSQTHEVTWDFGDKSKLVTGDKTTHAYKEIGEYTVKATCSLANKRTLSATAKITIVAADSTDNDDNNPNQGPVQSTPTQGSPSQTDPSQNRPDQSEPTQQ